MSSEETMSPNPSVGKQLKAILALELRKNFFGRRAFILYFLAAMPVALFVLVYFIPDARESLQNPAQAASVFAGVYNALILRFVVYFGCVWIFTNLFRGDILDGSLHYYFLSPIRREVLAAGKFLAGLSFAGFLFVGSTMASLILVSVPSGLSQVVLGSPGLQHTLTYIGITLLACLGYGAVFLAVGLVFRSPILPAIAFYGWEWLNFLLPPLLKKFSVVHYVQSMSPGVFSEDNPFAVLAEPTPAWIAVPGLLLFSLLVLGLAAWQARRMEIDYGGE